MPTPANTPIRATITVLKLPGSIYPLTEPKLRISINKIFLMSFNLNILQEPMSELLF